MLQGCHTDVTPLDALQVTATGEIARLHGVEKVLFAETVTMQTLCGGGRGLVLLEHVDRDGKPRIFEQRDMPVTWRGRVGTIILDLAVFGVVYMGDSACRLLLGELAGYFTVEELQYKTGGPISFNCRIE
ncbi:succinyl-CoA:3-ketoacid-coenzyme A transferase-like protein [Trypanosoma cruzi]|nr:succinyl-CoA:3-ketoacid-coenzyme A transferase-like protein [Trypanosoma cruzi]